MKIENIYVFGDSIHDTGNLQKATEGEMPSRIYHNGRFSNGPVYCDYVASIFSERTGRKVELKNFAYGGALTNYRNGYTPKAVSLKDQIDTFNFSFSENDLVILGCGPNNFAFFFDIYEFPFLHLKRIRNVAKDLEMCARKVIEKGAKNILVFNVPDIFMAPVKKRLNFLFKIFVAPRLAKALAKTNLEIDRLICTLNCNDIKTSVFDVHDLYTKVLTSPEEYSFKNSDLSIIPGVGFYDGEISKLKNHDEYVFWDYVHPTTKAHKMLAERLVALLSEKFDIA